MMWCAFHRSHDIMHLLMRILDHKFTCRVSHEAGKGCAEGAERGAGGEARWEVGADRWEENNGGGEESANEDDKSENFGQIGRFLSRVARVDLREDCVKENVGMLGGEEGEQLRFKLENKPWNLQTWVAEQFANMSSRTICKISDQTVIMIAWNEGGRVIPPWASQMGEYYSVPLRFYSPA